MYGCFNFYYLYLFDPEVEDIKRTAFMLAKLWNILHLSICDHFDKVARCVGSVFASGETLRSGGSWVLFITDVLFLFFSLIYIWVDTEKSLGKWQKSNKFLTIQALSCTENPQKIFSKLRSSRLCFWWSIYVHLFTSYMCIHVQILDRLNSPRVRVWAGCMHHVEGPQLHP